MKLFSFYSLWDELYLVAANTEEEAINIIKSETSLKIEECSINELDISQPNFIGNWF